MFLNSQFSHLVLMKLLGGRMLLCFATTHCIPTGSNHIVAAQTTQTWALPNVRCAL